METYKSKIDYLLVVTIYVIILGATVPTLIYAFSWIAIFMVVILLAFVSSLIFNTKYIVENDILSIKCGVLPVEKYNIQDICTIQNTNTIISSPAISLDRIEIRLTKRRSVVISPQDKNGFIETMCKINPSIIVK